jgi:hypothetical protein
MGKKENFVSQADMQVGQEVQFRIGDLVCPDVEQVLAEVGPDVRVSGEIAFLSDRGSDKGHFAILTVSGIGSPVIVPVSRLEKSEPRAVGRRAAS